MDGTIRVKTAVWFATAVVLSVFAILLVSEQWRAEAAPGDEDSTYVPVANCRLFDFRSGINNVGPKDTPLEPGEVNVYTQAVHGANGDCTIPSDAVGVAMNVTIANPTAQSNLRVFPADIATPNASNLNWLPGQSPTPNKVDVKLSSDGEIKLFNFNGTVNVLADVVGYYTDRSLKNFYTKDEVDALLAPPPGPEVLLLSGSSFQPTDVAGGSNGSFPLWYGWSPTSNSWSLTETEPSSFCYMAEAEFPMGSSFDLLKATYATDGSPGGDVTLYRSNGGYGSDAAVVVASLALPAPNVSGVRDAETATFSEATAVGGDLYLVEICQGWSKAFSDIQIRYTVPG